MEIARDISADRGRYSTTVEGHEAELTFAVSDGTWIAAHTGVPDAIGGRGVGKALVERMVADARAEGMRIVPRCPFVAALLLRNPGWVDAFAE